MNLSEGHPINLPVLLETRLLVQAGSGGYFNNLGRLRTLGAIDYPSRGHVSVAPLLFPK